LRKDPPLGPLLLDLEELACPFLAGQLFFPLPPCALVKCLPGNVRLFFFGLFFFSLDGRSPFPLLFIVFASWQKFLPGHKSRAFFSCQVAGPSTSRCTADGRGVSLRKTLGSPPPPAGRISFFPFFSWVPPVDLWRSCSFFLGEFLLGCIDRRAPVSLPWTDPPWSFPLLRLRAFDDLPRGSSRPASFFLIRPECLWVFSAKAPLPFFFPLRIVHDIFPCWTALLFPDFSHNFVFPSLRSGCCCTFPPFPFRTGSFPLGSFTFCLRPGSRLTFFRQEKFYLSPPLLRFRCYPPLPPKNVVPSLGKGLSGFCWKLWRLFPLGSRHTLSPFARPVSFLAVNNRLFFPPAAFLQFHFPRTKNPLFEARLRL